MSKHIVAKVDEIPLGGRKLVEIAGRSIGIFHVKGEFYAIRNRCPHQGGSLCEGRLTGLLTATQPGDYAYSRQGEILRCPWHGWEFDVKTGQSWFDPAQVRVRSYKVSVESISPAAVDSPTDEEAGLQKGPYLAETYPVTIEDAYVVVEI